MTQAQTYSYQFEDTKVVEPEDVSVLAPSKEPTLTLVTCFPFYYLGSAPQRFVVKVYYSLDEAHK